MKEIFAEHFSRYPAMQPQDAVKLAYQNTYGAGHLVSDPAAALEYLKAEAAPLSRQPGRSLLEPVGNGRCRLYLDAEDALGLSVESAGFLFLEGAHPSTLGPEALDCPLSLLRNMATLGETPFSRAQLDAYLAEYDGQGRPMVSHSEPYRKTYRPAYRVLEGHLARFVPLLAAIDQLLSEKPAVTVAIDGMSAAGKSSLSDLLLRRYGCEVIHMDDFFLPPELRTPERFSTPGGNVHHERFKAQVLDGLARGVPFSYQQFDCHSMTFSGEISVNQNRLTVIEGAYCLHPTLRDFYDLKVFFPIDPQQQLERIRLRNGEGCVPRFRDKWIPMENAYISACRVQECCDLIL